MPYWHFSISTKVVVLAGCFLLSKCDSLWSSKGIPLLPSISWMFFFLLKIAKSSWTLVFVSLIRWNLLFFLVRCLFLNEIRNKQFHINLNLVVEQANVKLCFGHLPLLKQPMIRFYALQGGLLLSNSALCSIKNRKDKALQRWIKLSKIFFMCSTTINHYRCTTSFTGEKLKGTGVCNSYSESGLLSSVYTPATG